MFVRITVSQAKRSRLRMLWLRRDTVVRDDGEIDRIVGGGRCAVRKGRRCQANNVNGAAVKGRCGKLNRTERLVRIDISVCCTLTVLLLSSLGVDVFSISE